MAVVRRHVSSDHAMPAQLIARRDGAPATGHQHLAILPCDLDHDGRIDTMLLGIGGSFHPALLAGISDLRTVRVHRELAIETEPCPLPEAPFQPSTSFVSTTPFVPPRYPKLRRGLPHRNAEGRWRHGPEEQLRFLLSRAGLPDPAPLRADDVRFGVWLSGRLVPWHDFVLERRHGGGKRGLAHGFGFHLTFPCPIRGPFASGYANHFGLGQFHPD